MARKRLTPSSRSEVMMLASSLDAELGEAAVDLRRQMLAYDRALAELVRQVHLHCAERGALLERCRVQQHAWTTRLLLALKVCACACLHSIAHPLCTHTPHIAHPHPHCTHTHTACTPTPHVYTHTACTCGCCSPCRRSERRGTRQCAARARRRSGRRSVSPRNLASRSSCSGRRTAAWLDYIAACLIQGSHMRPRTASRLQTTHSTHIPPTHRLHTATKPHSDWPKLSHRALGDPSQ